MRNNSRKMVGSKMAGKSIFVMVLLICSTLCFPRYAVAASCHSEEDYQYVLEFADKKKHLYIEDNEYLLCQIDDLKFLCDNRCRKEYLLSDDDWRKINRKSDYISQYVKEKPPLAYYPIKDINHTLKIADEGIFLYIEGSDYLLYRLEGRSFIYDIEKEKGYQIKNVDWEEIIRKPYVIDRYNRDQLFKERRKAAMMIPKGYSLWRTIKKPRGKSPRGFLRIPEIIDSFISGIKKIFVKNPKIIVELLEKRDWYNHMAYIIKSGGFKGESNNNLEIDKAQFIKRKRNEAQFKNRVRKILVEKRELSSDDFEEAFKISKELKGLNAAYLNEVLDNAWDQLYYKPVHVQSVSGVKSSLFVP